jgi:holo-[acyl-carrier protein] synthase
MIAGIGIDIVRITRMEHWLKKPEILERYFHSDELSYALSSGNNAAASLAARFAAKEAFGKALGTGLANITLKDIMILNKHNGKPEVMLFNTAKKALENSGAKKVHVSLTHEKENAVAMIVLEGI